MKTKTLLLVMMVPFFAFAQLKEPVSWSYSQKRISSNEVLLIFKAKIDKSWHLYTQFFEEGGPMKLVFTFNKSKDYELVGKVSESPKPHKVKDKIFKMEVQYLENTGTFTQKIKLLSKKNFVVKGEIEGQACSEADGSCVPLYPEFEFKIKAKK